MSAVHARNSPRGAAPVCGLPRERRREPLGGDAAFLRIPSIEAIASATTSRRKFLHRERSTFIGCARPGGAVRVSPPLDPPRADAAHVAATPQAPPGWPNHLRPQVRRFSGREQIARVLRLCDSILKYMRCWVSVGQREFAPHLPHRGCHRRRRRPWCAARPLVNSWAVLGSNQ